MKKNLLLLLSFCFLPLFAAVRLDGTFDWNGKDAKEVCPGIKYFTIALEEPRLLKAAVVRVDLTTPKLRFKMTPRAKEWGKPMPGFPQHLIRTRRMTCRKFMEESVKKGENMVVVVNGTPWSPWQKPWNHPYATNQGLLIADGVLVAPAYKKRPGFIVGKDGSFDFASFKDGDDISHIKHAISGFSTVLSKGKIVARDTDGLAPRTGYGLSADRKYLYLFVVDGRQIGYSLGTSTYEVAQFLQYAGASDGLNMDGGGSTTMFVRNEKEMIKLNHHFRGAERTVGGAMGIIIDK